LKKEDTAGQKRGCPKVIKIRGKKHESRIRIKPFCFLMLSPKSRL
jgi:hypothetical protein